MFISCIINMLVIEIKLSSSLMTVAIGEYPQLFANNGTLMLRQSSY